MLGCRCAADHESDNAATQNEADEDDNRPEGSRPCRAERAALGKREAPR